MTWNPDEELIAFINSLIDSSDTHFTWQKNGRRQLKHWEILLDEEPDSSICKKMVDIPELFSPKHLTMNLEQHHFSKGNLAEEIAT